MTFNVTFTCSVSLVNLEARWKIYPFPVINAGIVKNIRIKTRLMLLDLIRFSSFFCSCSLYIFYLQKNLPPLLSAYDVTDGFSVVTMI